MEEEFIKKLESFFNSRLIHAINYVTSERNYFISKTDSSYNSEKFESESINFYSYFEQFLEKDDCLLNDIVKYLIRYTKIFLYFDDIIKEVNERTTFNEIITLKHYVIIFCKVFGIENNFEQLFIDILKQEFPITNKNN